MKQEIIENLKFYKESGRFNPASYYLSFGICLFISFFLGYVYMMFCSVMPIVYLNVIGTIFMASMIGIIVRMAGRLSKNRNNYSILIMGLVCGVVAYYSAFAFIIHHMIRPFPTPGEVIAASGWIFNPNGEYQILGAMLDYAYYSIFGMPVKGGLLVLCWMVEFGIILGSIAIVILRTPPIPFSEALGNWYPTYELEKDFAYVSTPQKFMREVSKEPHHAVESLGNGTAFRYSRIRIFYSPKENEQYLSLDNVFISAKGDKGEKRTRLINNYIISNEQADTILKNYKSTKMNFAVLTGYS